MKKLYILQRTFSNYAQNVWSFYKIHKNFADTIRLDVLPTS